MSKQMSLEEYKQAIAEEENQDILNVVEEYMRDYESVSEYMKLFERYGVE